MLTPLKGGKTPLLTIAMEDYDVENIPFAMLSVAMTPRNIKELQARFEEAEKIFENRQVLEVSFYTEMAVPVAIPEFSGVRHLCRTLKTRGVGYSWLSESIDLTQQCPVTLVVTRRDFRFIAHIGGNVACDWPTCWVPKEEINVVG